MDLEKYFAKADLIPAIVQEKSTGEVLMLAYMNRESMQKTLETGYTWFWSRSRRELWNKGATSGHLQRSLTSLRTATTTPCCSPWSRPARLVTRAIILASLKK